MTKAQAQEAVRSEVIKINERLKMIAGKVSLEERRSIYLKAAKPLRDQAKQNVPEDTGLLKKALGKLNIARFADAIYIGVKLPKGSKRGNSAYYAHMVEYGTYNKDGSTKQEASLFFTRAYESTKDAVRRNVEILLTLAYQKAIRNVSK